MCSLNGSDWLKIAALIGAAAVTGGAAGVGPLAGMMGGEAAAGAAGLGALGEGAVAGDAFMPGLLGAELGPGAGAAGLEGAMAYGGGGLSPMASFQTGAMNLLGGSKNYDMAMRALGNAGKMQATGLLGGGSGQPRPQPLPIPPGGGAQTPGAPTSAQIYMPDAMQQQHPYYPLDEMLRRRMREYYG